MNDVERRRRSGKDVGMQLMKNDDFVGSRFSLLASRFSSLVSRFSFLQAGWQIGGWPLSLSAVRWGQQVAPKPGGGGSGGMGTRVGKLGMLGQIHTDTFRYHIGICLSYLMLEHASRSPSPIICHLSSVMPSVVVYRLFLW